MRQLSRTLLIAAAALTALPACGGPDDGTGTGGFADLFPGAAEAEEEAEEEEGVVEAAPDTVMVRVDGEEIVFANASGAYRGEGDNTVVFASRILDEGNESIALLVAGAEAVTVSCDVNNAVSWNAWQDGAAAAYSSRREGGSCTVDLATYGEVGGRLSGTFEAVLVDADGRVRDLRGAFDAPRGEDL